MCLHLVCCRTFSIFDFLKLSKDLFVGLKLFLNVCIRPIIMLTYRRLSFQFYIYPTTVIINNDNDFDDFDLPIHINDLIKVQHGNCT